MTKMTLVFVHQVALQVSQNICVRIVSKSSNTHSTAHIQFHASVNALYPAQIL